MANAQSDRPGKAASERGGFVSRVVNGSAALRGLVFGSCSSASHFRRRPSRIPARSMLDTLLNLGRSRVRESRSLGSVGAKAEWLSYPTQPLVHRAVAFARDPGRVTARRVTS